MDFQNSSEDTARLDRARLRDAGSRNARRRKVRKPHPRVGLSGGSPSGYVPTVSVVGGHGRNSHRRNRSSQVAFQSPLTDGRATRAYGKAAVTGGLFGTIVAVALSWFVCGYPAMWARRADIVAEMERVGTSEVDSPEWKGDLPPISWRLTCDEKQTGTRIAVLEDIRAMIDPDAGFGLFSWPALPYMVGTGHASDCEELLKIVSGIYSDYPELSVYTDGQCVQAVAAVARYMLPASSGVNSDDNKSEYEMVTERLDEIASECDKEAGDDDLAYISSAYRHIASGCAYASDDEESSHSNDIYGALVEGKSRCYGGSGALKGLLDRRGIPSFMASGAIHSDPSQRHAWNVIWYDGEWYVCDVTCSMGTVPENENSFYWGCMKPYEEYMDSQDILIDDDDKELMKAYEERISSLHGAEANDNDMS